MAVAESVYQRVRARERTHPQLVGDVLRALADVDQVVVADDDHRALATMLVDDRAASDLERFRTQALTTREVTMKVSGLTDRRSVEARRRRGQLLGLTIGRDTHHPDWQFTRGRTRDRLDEVLAALLPAAGGEPVIADRIMREPRDELGGASLADLYAEKRTDEVVAYLAMRTEGFTA